jgi:hypothetical protein
MMGKMRRNRDKRGCSSLLLFDIPILSRKSRALQRGLRYAGSV